MVFILSFYLFIILLNIFSDNAADVEDDDDIA
jgi:hypothetical protein